MALRIISGRASNLRQGSDYQYAANAQYGPVPIKNQLISMRLDNSPVFFRTRTLPSIGEGDHVAAIGSEKNGTLEALALRNVTTGAIYYPSDLMMTFVLSAALIVLGIPLIAFLGFGLLFVGVGVWVLRRALTVRFGSQAGYRTRRPRWRARAVRSRPAARPCRGSAGATRWPRHAVRPR